MDGECFEKPCFILLGNHFRSFNEDHEIQQWEEERMPYIIERQTFWGVTTSTKTFSSDHSIFDSST